MNTRKVIFLGVMMVAIAAITVPLVSFNAGASGTTASAKALTAARANAAAVTRTTPVEVKQEGQPQSEIAAMQETGSGKISDETLRSPRETPMRRCRQTCRRGRVLGELLRFLFQVRRRWWEAEGRRW